MKHLKIDYEYIEKLDKTYHYLICAVIQDYHTKEVWEFDLRQTTKLIEDFFNRLNLEETRFYAYAIANAEIPVTCQIMGADWVIRTNWVCLWTEFKMFGKSHPEYYCGDSDGLADCLKIFDVQDEYLADKETARNLILYHPNQMILKKEDRLLRIETYHLFGPNKNDFHYEQHEFEQILFYCRQDVIILTNVIDKLKQISKNLPININHWLKRGEHCKFAGISQYKQKGYPIDVHKFETIINNVERIEVKIAENCNQQTGYEIYKANYKGPQRNKVFTGFSFNMENFTNYIKSKELYDSWEKTESGQLKLTEKYLNDYLDEKASDNKEIIEPVYFARNTIKQLHFKKLNKLMTEDGFIKGLSYPFHQKTSRTSPLPSKGFILNMTPWLRMLIHPKPDHAFVSVDFKSQEVLIAAILSKDESMLEDYLTDIYMGQAIKTGFAKLGATKQSDPETRKGFKPITLGVSYGMGVDTLAIRFKNLFDLKGEPKPMYHCKKDAEIFLSRYKRVYHKYIQFIKEHFRKSRGLKYYESIDNWIYFISSHTKDTQLKNIPCQSGGGALIREAHDRCVKDGIWVINHHDALDFYCKESEAVTLAKIVSRHMCEASRDLLGADYMQTETIIFTHAQPYYDQRGEHIYKMIMNELNLDCPEKFNKPKEIQNIHLT